MDSLDVGHLQPTRHERRLDGNELRGEGDAASRFAAGNVDLAYTATGYNPDVGLVDAAALPAGVRPAVAVPIGISAVVLGLANGYFNSDGRKLPYDDVHLTVDELTDLVTGGQWQVDQPALWDENPQLAAGGVFQQGNVSFRVGAPAWSGSSTWLLTRYLHDLRPARWKVPELPLFGDVTGRPRTQSNSFALADPSFAGALDLYDGRPALVKQVDGLAPDPGGVWAITDLTTAEALDVYPVTIDNAQGVANAAQPAIDDRGGECHVARPRRSASVRPQFLSRLSADLRRVRLRARRAACRRERDVPDRVTSAARQMARLRRGRRPVQSARRAATADPGVAGAGPDSAREGRRHTLVDPVPDRRWRRWTGWRGWPGRHRWWCGRFHERRRCADAGERLEQRRCIARWQRVGRGRECRAVGVGLRVARLFGANLPSVLLAIGALAALVWMVVAATRASAGGGATTAIVSDPVRVEASPGRDASGK